MPRARSNVTVGIWIKLARAVQEENMEGKPHLQRQYGRLTGFIKEVETLEAQRAFHTARKQEATRRIREVLEEGNRVATTVRLILKDEYGPTNERLVEFGIQPFRGRKRRRKSADGETPGEAAEATEPESR